MSIPLDDAALRDASSKKMAAGLCGILLGGPGIHKFILGYTTPGVIMLFVGLLSCGTITSVVGLIEGIIYLTRTDDDFYQTYIVGKKEWF